MLERRTRPSRGEIDEAALALLARHGAQILATARRYAASAEDAEDAYQRGLEILLTKAPTTREDELVPWLKTVVKHEAFALRRQRERLTPVTGDGEPVERGTTPSATHEQAERYERLRQGAEALRRLKPQEIRCLVLRAQGLSYREICNATGFTYTKVNRCLTEGRQALSGRLAGIEGGIECTRLAPLLSALADGEATPEQLARLRPHMKSCLACRARLREFRAAPARVAALVPVGLLAASAAPRLSDGHSGAAPALRDGPLSAGQSKLEALFGSLQQKAEAVLGATQHKAAVFAERTQTAAELLTANKIAAVAASAAALAGGGTAVDHLANHHGPPRPATAHHAKSAQAEHPQPAHPAPSQPAAAPEPAPTTEHPQSPTPPPESPPPPPDPANEFAPATTARPQASESTHPLPESASSSTGSAPARSIARATPAPRTQAAPTAPDSADEFAP